MPRTRKFTFSDGSTETYEDIPDDVTDEQLVGRIAKDVPGKKVVDMDRTGGEEASMFVRSGGIAGADLANAVMSAASWSDPSRWTPQIADAVGLGEYISPTDRAIANAKAHPGMRNWVNTIADKMTGTKPVTENERMRSEITSGVLGAAYPAIGVEAVTARAAGTAIPKLAAAGRIGMQAASGGLSAAAAEGARQRGASPWVQTGLGLAAGMGPFGLASMVRNLGSKVITYAKPSWEGAKERAAELFRENTSNVDRAINRIETAPPPVVGSAPVVGPPTQGVRPLTADITRDPKQAALQRQQMTTPILERSRANAQERQRAADNAMGTGDPIDIARLDVANQARNEADLAARVSDINPPPPPRVQQGATLAGEVATGHTGAKAASTTAYENPAITTPEPVVLSDQLVQRITGTLTNYFGNWKGGVPNRIRSALSNFIDDTGQLINQPVTTTNIQNIIQRLKGQAGKRAANGDQAGASAIMAVIDDIGADVGAQFTQQRAAALDAAAQTRLSQGQRFEQGPFGQATGKQQFGEPNTFPTELPGAVVQPGARGGTLADQLNAAITPQSAERHVRQELRRIVDEGGDITSETLGDFGELAQRFPRLQGDIRRLQSQAKFNADYLDTPLATMGDTGKKGVNSKIEAFLKGDGDNFTNLLVQVRQGGAQAMEGLRRTLGNYIVNSGTRGGKIRSAAGEVIPRNDAQLAAIENVLERGGGALTAEQRQVLEAVRHEMRGVQFADKGGKLQKGQRIGRDVPLPTFYARVTNFLANYANNTAKRDNFIQQALMNPDFALELLKYQTPKRLERLAKTLAMTGVASTIGGQSGEPDEVEEY